MDDKISMQIDVPSDNDGFVLFQCPLCGDFFKIRPSDYEDDGILEIYCPNCGLCSDSYYTEDVMDLAMTMAQNAARDLVNKEMKKLEKSLNSGNISFKVEKQLKKEYELPIYETIEAFSIKYFECCKREAKIKPLLTICGCYCPFCGVKCFGN